MTYPLYWQNYMYSKLHACTWTVLECLLMVQWGCWIDSSWWTTGLPFPASPPQLLYKGHGMCCIVLECLLMVQCGCQIDSSWWTHIAVSLSSQCSTTAIQRPWYVLYCARVPANGVMGVSDRFFSVDHRVSLSSQCSTTAVTKAVVCAILYVGWCM